MALLSCSAQADAFTPTKQTEALDTTALGHPLPTIHRCHDLLRAINERTIGNPRFQPV